MGAQKLKEWQKTDDQKKPSENPHTAGSDTIHKEDLICLDQATQFSTGDKDISTQEHLDKPLTFPVEPMTCHPDIVHPIPSTS